MAKLDPPDWTALTQFYHTDCRADIWALSKVPYALLDANEVCQKVNVGGIFGIMYCGDHDLAEKNTHKVGAETTTSTG